MPAFLTTTMALAVLAAFAATVALTPLVRATARRIGMVTRPRADRWSKKPTALLGGVAVFFGFMPIAFALTPFEQPYLVVYAGSALMFAVGLIDDLRPLKPYQKLIGQIVASTVLVVGGLTLPWTSWPLANAAITLIWLIGITNAINLLDNMDGLAGGVSGIAALTLVVSFGSAGDHVTAVIMAAFTAAIAGFLIYNFNPASIFMGDCGSLFIGFFLAAAALLNLTGGRTSGLVPVLAVPVLILLIPIFDTTLVTVVRKLAGRAVSQGGRDHSSHRLVALGLSERRAVLLLYALAAAAGGVSILIRYITPDISLLVIAAFIMGLTLFGIHLAGVKVYSEQIALDRPITAFIVNISYKRRIFEVLLDVALIGLAYWTANIIVFGPLKPAGVFPLVIETLPFIIPLKLVGFLVAGVYRGIWRYVGTSDLYVFVKAAILGTVTTVIAFVLLYRFEGLSRAVFAIDCLLLLVLLTVSRFAFHIFRLILHPPRRNGQRVLIYGAGDAGELLAREMQNNHNLGCIPIAFADDDPRKINAFIRGLKVFGGNGKLVTICQEQQIDEVYISSANFTDHRVREISSDCQQAGVRLKRLRITFETIEGEEDGND